MRPAKPLPVTRIALTMTGGWTNLVTGVELPHSNLRTGTLSARDMNRQRLTVSKSVTNNPPTSRGRGWSSPASFHTAPLRALMPTGWFLLGLERSCLELVFALGAD